MRSNAKGLSLRPDRVQDIFCALNYNALKVFNPILDQFRRKKTLENLVNLLIHQIRINLARFAYSLYMKS